MPAQREYFQMLAETGSEAEARKRLNLSDDRVNRWRRTDDAFKRAYDDYSREVVEVVKTQTRVLTEKATAAVDSLLEEMKPVKVVVDCSECGHKNTTFVRVRDATTRAKMVEMVWKATGVLKDVRRIEGEVGVTHMTVGQKMALALYKDGKQVSEQARRELIGMGLIEEDEGGRPPSDPNIVEGEAREVVNGL